MRALILAILCAAPLAATPWDRDRPGDRHVANVADACSGRFDRLPPRYYEMRVERLQVQLAAAKFDDETTLAKADNLAVALLRLGRIPTALQWIDRKQAALDSLRSRDRTLFETHTERNVKNKAMCLLARWRQAGDAKDLEAALALAERAADIGRLNTENGFVYREIEFLRRAVPPADAIFPSMLGLTELNLRGGGKPGSLFALRLDGAVPHLLRRVTYGGEHENADLYYALSLALAMEGRTDDAGLAWARLCELIDTGARLHVSHKLSNDALKRALAWHLKGDQAAWRMQLGSLRAAANLWAEDRAAKIAAALERGEHPDTMPDFWTRWMQKKPKLEEYTGSLTSEPKPPDPAPMIGTALWAGAGVAVLVLFLVVAAMALVFARRHPSPPKVDEL